MAKSSTSSYVAEAEYTTVTFSVLPTRLVNHLGTAVFSNDDVSSRGGSFSARTHVLLSSCSHLSLKDTIGGTSKILETHGHDGTDGILDNCG